MTSEQCTHATWCTGERDHEYDCSVATQLADLTAERDALRARAEAAELERDDMRLECASISKEFGLPPTIRPAEGEITRLLATAKEVGRLTRQVADLERTAACAEDMRDAAERERDALRARAEAAEKEAATWKEEAAERGRESDDRKDRYDDAVQELTRLERERDELRAEVERLRGALTNAVVRYTGGCGDPLRLECGLCHAWIGVEWKGESGLDIEHADWCAMHREPRSAQAQHGEGKDR
jgi:chromosome segregation ATPase